MVKWLKAKWTKLYWWYQRVFHNRIRTIKPSGTLSTLQPYTSGIEPCFNPRAHYGLELKAHNGRLIHARQTYSEREI